MYLKRLDLQGFKSFPDKLKLEFNLGITAVVGPNGSGKSNISDAVRWVLGEQSAKSLRGGKMEDVIFAGTQNRKAVGFAEVSLLIDNEDYKIPIEFSEVTITRRVYRSGESEYLINKSPCRLKDIHELFMDTGVGKEGYSIIGQGRIDEILSAKSEDRRLLFEEATGISKYKNRRQEAEHKLEKEKQNLLRLEDIIIELSSQLEPLHGQAQKAKKYLYVREQLKLLDINIFLLESTRIEEALGLLENSYGTILHQIEYEKHLYQNEKEEYSKIKQSAEELERKRNSAQQELTILLTSLEKTEGNSKLKEEQIIHIQQDLGRIHKEIKKIQDKIHILQEDSLVLESKYNGVSLQVQIKNEELLEKQKSFELLNVSLSSSEKEIEIFKSTIIERLRSLSDVKSELQRITSFHEQLHARHIYLEKEKKHITSQTQDKNTYLQVVMKKSNEATALLKSFDKKISDFKTQCSLLDRDIDKKTGYITTLEQKRQEMSSKYKVLAEMQKDHEGFYKSVKSLLQVKDQNPFVWEGICGVVAELLSVPVQLETALEVALGASMQNVITTTEEEAKRAIEYLKKHELGRATFLPLTAIRSKSLGSEKQVLLKEPGVLGVASDLVDYAAKYECVMTNLLGKVLVVDHLDQGILLAKKYKYAYKIVTLAGDLINPGGALTGGSIHQKTVHIFGRSRELEKLHLSLEDQKIILMTQNTELTTKKQEKKQLESEIINLQADVQKIHIEQVSLQHQSQQIKQNLGELKEKLDDLVLEQNQLSEQQLHMDEELKQKNIKLFCLEEDITKIQEKLNEFQSTIQYDRLSKEDIVGQITNSKVEISSLEQEQKALYENICRIQKEIDLFQLEVTHHKNDIIALESTHIKKKEDIQKININLEMLNQSRDQKQEELSLLDENKKKTALSIQSYEEMLQQKSNQLSLLQNELYRIEHKKTNLTLEQENICNTIWESYEITTQSAKQYPKLPGSLSALQKEGIQYKNEIKNLGNINVDAIEEYKIIKDRYEFLTAQKADILDAEHKLRQIIQELTHSMEQQFTEQFSIISQNFSETFKELFGGGKAYLHLSNTQNVLESGIDIIAQPPGKKLQNMLLLSGGERALTAIALLFGILKMKPSPFCILDEIEAALDDANVNRYATYLKKFSQDTQFIIVTHRKGTMEVADALYGVTMQEQGVSKLVSVKFTEDEAS